MVSTSSPAEEPRSSAPEAAPAVTRAQVDAFIDQVRAIVPLSKPGGGKRKGGPNAEIVCDAEGLVVDGREGWLTRKVHQTACHMQAAGGVLDVEELAARAWEVFQNTASNTDGRWAPADAEIKARALIDRVRRRVITLGPAGPATPTYPDERLSLRDAEAKVAEIVGHFFTTYVPSWWAEVAAYELAVAELPTS
jgi:hypothetical protein